MERLHELYNQKATHFSLRLFIKPETEVDGRLVIDLADIFLSELIFPGCRIASLDTKRQGQSAKLNMGAFSDTRWRAAAKKVLAGQYAAIGIRAHTADFPNQEIALSVHVNPPGGEEFLVSGDVSITCSIPYLRHLAASPQKVEALLELGKRAWNGVPGGAAYGFANLAITLARAPFQPWAPRPPDAPFPWDYEKPPFERAHAVPVAYVGNDIDGNLASLYCNGRGIKGAFWANYLSASHVNMAGGEQQIRSKVGDMRIEPLQHGALLIVATDNPLPQDSDENRERFLRLHAALQPAFLSRDETVETKRPMLGYFYRERTPNA
jgi:hypothetical protein